MVPSTNQDKPTQSSLYEIHLYQEMLSNCHELNSFVTLLSKRNVNKFVQVNLWHAFVHHLLFAHAVQNGLVVKLLPLSHEIFKSTICTILLPT